jgi:FKBP-type peptidyl-prolyl cis-trans isomerase SlpA
MAAKIQPDSFVTLHYRLAAGDDLELMNTFSQRPATLQMGSGQLAPTLEKCILGLEEGISQTFELEPGEAFGARADDLVQRIPRSSVSDNYLVEPMAQIDFQAEDGRRFSGFVREADETSVLMDFNHPLAGKPVTFQVQIIGVL